jgi:primosomal replication protein N
MSLNRVIVSGTISTYGQKLSYTESGKPQVSFSLIVEESGKEGASYKTFIPVLIAGGKPEDLAETLEAGSHVLLEGTLAYKAGKTKDAGKLLVTSFSVEVLTQAIVPQDAATGANSAA